MVATPHLWNPTICGWKNYGRLCLNPSPCLFFFFHLSSLQGRPSDGCINFPFVFLLPSPQAEAESRVSEWAVLCISVPLAYV